LAIEAGKDQLTKTMRKLGLPLQQLMSADSLGKIVGELGIQDLSALFASIGEGQISAQSIIDRLTVPGVNEDENESEFELPSAPKSFRKVATGDSGVLVKGDGDVMVKLARCCTPVPGDEIMGFVTRGSGVSVHRNDCKNADSLKLESERLVDVSWAPSSKRLFLVQIQVEALDRSGLLSDVTRVLSEHHVNILSASVSTRTDRIALSRFVFEMGDPAALDHLLAAVKRIEAVYDVYRVSQ
jgi:GTP pyrophosphokinase